MKKILFFTFIISCFSYSQQKKDWFFGAETGLNTIKSYRFNEESKSIQAGLFAQYYMVDHFSIIGRIKYFKTGVSFSNQGTSGYFLSSPGNGLRFEGEVISVPIVINGEFDISSKLNGNIKIGLAYNYETKSNYNFNYNIDNDNTRSFESLNLGFGLNYFISKKTALYVDYEIYRFGGYKGNSNSLVFSKNYYTTNNLLNFGIKTKLLR